MQTIIKAAKSRKQIIFMYTFLTCTAKDGTFSLVDFRLNLFSDVML